MRHSIHGGPEGKTIGDNDLEAMRLIDRRQLAMLLGISPKTLSNRKARRDIPDPVSRGGSHPRWRLDEIRQWLATTDSRGRLLDADAWNARKPKRR